jgi:hypothetical protein
VFPEAVAPKIHGRVLPHSEAVPAGADLNIATRADRGETIFSNLLSVPAAVNKNETQKRNYYVKQSQNHGGL